MKKNLFLLSLCALLLSACHIGEIRINGGAQIEPSANIVKQEFQMGDFDKIDIDVIANVKIIQSDDQPRVVLSAPDNYVELFEFDVANRKLDVEFSRSGVNIDAEHVDITIYTRTLHKLENDGLANIEISSWKGDRLEVENSGVGSMYLSGLAMGEVVADCSGVGNIELNGKAKKAVLDCSGVGSVDAKGLKANEVKGDCSGVGSIHCYAIDYIDAEVSGVGSLEYGGKPKQKDLRRTGVGNINEL